MPSAIATDGTVLFTGGDGASAVRNKISSEGQKDGINFNWDKVGCALYTTLVDYCPQSARSAEC